MFYIREIFLRLQYLFFSFIGVTSVCFLKKNVLMFLLTESVLSCYNGIDIDKIDHFIYTHPTELFTVQIFLVLYFSLVFIFPYIVWLCLDFLKSSLSITEYNQVQILSRLTLCLGLTFNFLGFVYLFPNIWFFLENFNASLTINQGATFLLELRIYEYFLFAVNFIKVLNFSALFVLLLVSLFSFYSLQDLLHWKKLFIFLNMVFATLLSPPDVYSQLSIFLVLTFVLEFLICVLIFVFKINKFVVFNTVTY